MGSETEHTYKMEGSHCKRKAQVSGFEPGKGWQTSRANRLSGSEKISSKD